MSSTSRLPALTLRVLLGVVLAIALVECGLRLYFHEHEVDRTYWGRGAFIAADGLPYRHPPNATLRLGREGSFQHEIHTNAGGFRDLRDPPSAVRGRRLLVAGASFAMGMGVSDPADLFHVRLEERLRKRRGWPDDLEVYNVSQTGFNTASIAALLRENMERYSPEAVILLLSPNAFRPQPTAETEIVHGLRMRPDRFGAGTALDWVRARSLVFRRFANPFSGGLDFHAAQLLGGPSPNEVDLSETESQIGALRKLRDELAARGTVLFCVPVGDVVRASDALRQLGFRVIAVPPKPEWTIPGDPHMNALGHRSLAAAVAHALPSYQLVERLDR